MEEILSSFFILTILDVLEVLSHNLKNNELEYCITEDSENYTNQKFNIKYSYNTNVMHLCIYICLSDWCRKKKKFIKLKARYCFKIIFIKF